jgi:2-polyprenyl-6-methoxyphenol hydroxylase-like FAD-dependent oxidoreductase
MPPSTPAPDEEVDVLVIGGSLVGLSTAMFLGIHGIRAVAVERHASTAIHPRAGHFQLRTSEVLRSAGLEERVRRRSEEQYLPNGGINNVESLAGREIASYFPNLNAGVEEFSPTIRMFIDQDALEPILRERALDLGAELRYRTQCTALEQDADGVTATLRDLENNSELTMRAQFVVAADGNRSPTREQLGIAMHGHGLLSNSVTIYFRADVDLSPLLAGRDQGVNYVTNPVLRGFFRLDRTGNRGFLVVNLVGERRADHRRGARARAPARRHRRPGDPGHDRGHRHLARGGRQRRALRRGPRVPGRRRGPHDAAQRRLWRQYRRAGRPQSGLEARLRAQGHRRRRAPGQL